MILLIRNLLCDFYCYVHLTLLRGNPECAQSSFRERLASSELGLAPHVLPDVVAEAEVVDQNAEDRNDREERRRAERGLGVGLGAQDLDVEE